MSYLNHLAQAATNGVGSPPAPRARNIGAPPAFSPQPHVAPPPYTVAKDPGWAGIVDPNDHELVNVLDKMEPEERQLFQTRIQQLLRGLKGGAPGGAPDGAPPQMPSPVPVVATPTPGI